MMRRCWISHEAIYQALYMQGRGALWRPQSAVAILVSNNAYRLGRALGSGTRPRLDRGLLGIAVLAPMAASANGSARRKIAMQQWTAPEFQIDSDGPAAAGIDGEAMHLDPPLRFRTRPRALRVSQGTARQDRAAPSPAPHHPGASRSALVPDTAWQTIEALASFALHGGEAELAEVRLSPAMRSTSCVTAGDAIRAAAWWIRAEPLMH